MLKPIMWRNDKISVGDELKLPPRTLDVSAPPPHMLPCFSDSPGPDTLVKVFMEACATSMHALKGGKPSADSAAAWGFSQRVPVHFGDGERLFYGKVQDAAVPIRQALAVTEELDSPHGAHDSPPSSPRKLRCRLSQN